MVGEERSASISPRLATFAAGVRADSLPDRVRLAARTSFTDQVGVILAASGLGADCKAFTDLALESGGSGATLLGRRAETAPSMAALANGAMAHALDFEETHDRTLVHPSASSVPAALAVGEAAGASGSDLIAAICAGSEVACRIGAGFKGNPQAHNHFFLLPLVNAFGAAAAAGRVLRLTAEQMEQAFSLAMSQVVGSAAVLTEPSSSFREVRDGFNAKAGVLAAQLAARGVRGFSSPLEAEHGYYAMFANGEFEPSAFESLGEEYEMATVSYKPWPACRGAHVFIEAAIALCEDHALRSDDIDAVEVNVSPFFAALCEPKELKTNPGNAIAAKFSIPYCVAVAIVDGDVGLQSFDDEKRRDPNVQALAERVRHRVNDAPQNESTRGALTLALRDGRKFSKSYDQPRGHPSRPIGEKRLLEKFRMCSAQAACPTGAEAADRFIRRAAALEEVSDIRRELVALL